METRKEYLAPELTVVSFRVENGFVGSTPLFNQLLFWNYEMPEQVESYSQSANWNDGNDFWN